ncbi:receptor-type tyrosine-protein phosphatase N2-like [Periophthalmus magnuspinnatus]|uniref:receptor-type tyrosine-protein phosphatase N2-like n=1 Tax=Periophthalmus magnuspinnatus TaxID=409849 RepID=UPI002436AB1F|nr:receptor-type tyrosine-protein phosphatase N2-like [Periophthalmus magnuspinnatus]
MAPLSSLHLLLLLAFSHRHLLVSADRRFGCLFDTELCSSHEICINDGMFGRCHRRPLQDLFSYDVSPSVVQRFRLLLQKLSSRGLTWEDDITQKILSKELSKLRRIPLRPQPGPGSGPGPEPVYSPEGRPQALDPVEQRVEPVEQELRRNLQMYLQRVGLLPKASAAAAAVSGKLSRLQPSTAVKPPFPQKLSQDADERLLVDTLRQLLSSSMSQTGGGGRETPAARPRPSFSGSRTGARDPLSSVDERFIESVLRNIWREHVDVDSLSQHDVDQLSTFITDALQVVDRDQGRKQDRDLSQDLSQGPSEAQGGQTAPGLREVEPEDGEESPKGTPKTPTIQEDRRSDDQKLSVKPEGEQLLNKLLTYLDKTSVLDSDRSRPAPKPGLNAGSPVDSVNSVDSSLGSSLGGRVVGLESVQSRTREGTVSVQKKDTRAQSVEELSEVLGWVKEVQPAPAAVLYGKPQGGPRGEPRGGLQGEPRGKAVQVPELELDVRTNRRKPDKDEFGYVITDTDGLQTDEGLHLMEVLAHMSNIHMANFAELSVVGPAVTFKVSPNQQNVSTADVARVAVDQKDTLERETKFKILEAGVADETQINQIPTKYSQAESTKFLVLTVVSILCIILVLLGSTVIYCLRNRSHHKLKEKLSTLGQESSADPTSTYQELCRQRMSVKPSERSEPLSSRINSVSSQFSDAAAGLSSPSGRASLSSWSEEPAASSLDISTGHMILAYMEDHLKNKDRLEQEWEALCAYQAEPNSATIGLKDGNAKKNRSAAVVAYDHSRITLKVENSQANSDYINASPIMDHDPRSPAYIATQGPLPSTVADFWQMVWENGCVVIVMLTPLVESGVKQCYHYWPDEGSNLYHIYEVNLVSEHIWCDDFLVRSFYLKNMQTNETRTVTQFHFLTWLSSGAPDNSRTLLDFRRKVNKCYRGRSCPIIVHCSDGAGRTGTYILIDMVLNKMAKGAKEIDIAATLEHLRDQRPGMVQTKDQFEFALTTVAEEVNAILKALPQ